MSYYYKDPEAIREALRIGWMHTGDPGLLDDERFLYIVDRKKDMIITGKESVYAGGVEGSSRYTTHEASFGIGP